MPKIGWKNLYLNGEKFHSSRVLVFLLRLLLGVDTLPGGTPPSL